ncbi:hypothetical protein V5O48_013639 [Marasmius crinis-equi]|uniref:Uncharacterized protein n=1 Tax=Marasmius crinis-equi TaxID=585013 RepID=A0ABR3EZI3_9AGAR
MAEDEKRERIDEGSCRVRPTITAADPISTIPPQSIPEPPLRKNLSLHNPRPPASKKPRGVTGRDYEEALLGAMTDFPRKGEFGLRRCTQDLFSTLVVWDSPSVVLTSTSNSCFGPMQ